MFEHLTASNQSNKIFIKSFGHNDEVLERLLYGGLCNWGDPVSRVLEEGRLLVKETAAPDTRGFVRALLAGKKLFYYLDKL